MNVVTTVIKARHSVRKYKSEKIDDFIIRDVLECARLAPTAMNLQPWLIGVIKNREILEKVADLTEHGKFIASAPVCFAVFGDKKATYYLEDCCAATENIIVALQAYGVGTCWVAGDKKGYAEPVRKLLEVPADYTLVSLVPAGIPSDISLVTKKDLKHIVFYESYEKKD